MLVCKLPRNKERRSEQGEFSKIASIRVFIVSDSTRLPQIRAGWMQPKIDLRVFSARIEPNRKDIPKEEAKVVGNKRKRTGLWDIYQRQFLPVQEQEPFHTSFVEWLCCKSSHTGSI